MAFDRAKILVQARKQAPGLLVEALVNFVLPAVIYALAKPALGEVKALLASSAPPMIWAVLEFARHRRIDALSLLVLAGIILSLLAFLGGGSAKFLQLREKLVTVIIGAAFLLSVVFDRPLIYELARASMKRQASPELAAFEGLKDNAGFRRAMRLMTLVWGLGLIGEAALSMALVFILSIGQFLIVGPLLGYAVMGGLSLWTFLYVRRRRAMRSSLLAEVGIGPQGPGPDS